MKSSVTQLDELAPALAAVLGEDAPQPLVALCRREVTPILRLEGELGAPVHDLHGPLHIVPDERGAQHRMALDGLPPGALEPVEVELPSPGNDELLEIGSRLPRQQGMEEEPLLDGGQPVEVFDIRALHQGVSLKRANRRSRLVR